MTEFFGPWDGQPEDGEVVETTETVETVTTTTKKTRSAPVGPRLWLRPWSWLAHQVYFCPDLFRADLHGICKKTQKKNLLKLEFGRDGWNIFIASVSLSEVFILDRLSVTGAVNACARGDVKQSPPRWRRPSLSGAINWTVDTVLQKNQLTHQQPFKNITHFLIRDGRLTLIKKIHLTAPQISKCQKRDYFSAKLYAKSLICHSYGKPTSGNAK